MGAFQLHQRACFARETTYGELALLRRAFEALRKDHLERHLNRFGVGAGGVAGRRRFVDGTPDRAHPAFADFGNQAITPGHELAGFDPVLFFRHRRRSTTLAGGRPPSRLPGLTKSDVSEQWW